MLFCKYVSKYVANINMFLKQHNYIQCLYPLVYRLRVIVPSGRGLYICLPSESNGPNLLDKPLKGFIVNPTDLPW